MGREDFPAPGATFDVKRDQFLDEVQERAELDNQRQAEEATEAVLTTLGERIVGGEADDLAAQLPEGIGDALTAADSDEQFDFAPFTDRVGERMDSDASEKRVAQVVTSVVVDATTTGELQDLVSEFPKNEGYGEMLALADQNAA